MPTLKPLAPASLGPAATSPFGFGEFTPVTPTRRGFRG
jgi:hypothetical protein